MREADESLRRLMEIALQLEGLYRHASTHAAGLVIGDRPLTELVPVYRDPKSEFLVTQYSMKYVEQAGLVKFDFLGLTHAHHPAARGAVPEEGGHRCRSRPPPAR